MRGEKIENEERKKGLFSPFYAVKKTTTGLFD